MEYSKKFGIVVILISFLLALLSLMVSGPWEEGYSFVYGFMASLHISLFPENSCAYNCKYLIDFPVKYAVFAFLTSAIYGLTTYFGITQPIKIDFFKRLKFQNLNDLEKIDYFYLVLAVLIAFFLPDSLWIITIVSVIYFVKLSPRSSE